jgi:hypothetical protein
MKTSSPARLLLALAALALWAPGRPGACAAGEPGPTPRELARMSPCELDRLFAAAGVGCLPVGLGRGRVLYVAEAHRPRARARVQSVVWKGKYFYPDGAITNQWCGFRAVASHAEVGPSWCDGRPCVVIEYPPDAPVFGNARDELREVAPGVFLGRYYERCPCPKWAGYFVLEFAGCGKHAGPACEE